jgi:hypothetical protein
MSATTWAAERVPQAVDPEIGGGQAVTPGFSKPQSMADAGTMLLTAGITLAHYAAYFTAGAQLRVEELITNFVIGLLQPHRSPLLREIVVRALLAGLSSGDVVRVLADGPVHALPAKPRQADVVLARDKDLTIVLESEWKLARTNGNWRWWSDVWADLERGLLVWRQTAETDAFRQELPALLAAAGGDVQFGQPTLYLVTAPASWAAAGYRIAEDVVRVLVTEHDVKRAGDTWRGSQHVDAWFRTVRFSHVAFELAAALTPGRGTGLTDGDLADVMELASLVGTP